MRKLLALATLVGTALVIGVSPASTAKIDDLHGGPVCADILNDSGIFDYDPAAGTVTFALRTAAPSCRGVLYTVNVYSDTGSSIGYDHKKVEIGRWFVGAALLLGLLSATLSVLWSSKLP